MTSSLQRFTPSPEELAGQQKSMALDGFRKISDVETVALPLRLLLPNLQNLTALSSRASELTPLPGVTKILETLDNTRVALQEWNGLATKTIADIRKEMATKRFREFRVNFNWPRLNLLKGGETCLICCSKRVHVYSFQCCSTPDSQKPICMKCLASLAFVSSRYGTEQTAACPFCKQQFYVYKRKVNRLRCKRFIASQTEPIK